MREREREREREIERERHRWREADCRGIAREERDIHIYRERGRTNL